MKKWMMILIAAFVATTFAACGDHDHNGNGNHDGHDHDEHGDHDKDAHEELHKKAVSLGSKTVDGYKVSMKFAFDEHESAAIVAIEKDGKPVTDAQVVVVVQDGDGKQIGESADSSFEDDHKDYDAHVIVPKDHEGHSLKVRVIHGGDPKEVVFDLK
ncbi:hypothetical protein OAU50_02090 [Planctomycetota bacterium]|nr:hypothetical protein [Planctomycetota bacterium]